MPVFLVGQIRFREPHAVYVTKLLNLIQFLGHFLQSSCPHSPFILLMGFQSAPLKIYRNELPGFFWSLI
jgi:hypothetical protein